MHHEKLRIVPSDSTDGEQFFPAVMEIVQFRQYMDSLALRVKGLSFF